MKRNSQLSVALHILTHLAAAEGRSITSEVMAAHLRTNPVVVRRSLAGLREAGFVNSVKGHGGGWTLARPAAEISLDQVYGVLGGHDELWPAAEPDLLGCKIETVVRKELGASYAEVNDLLRRRFDKVTIADLLHGVKSADDEREPMDSVSDLS